MKARIRSSYAAALNSQSASLSLLNENAVFLEATQKASAFLILIPDLRVFGMARRIPLPKCGIIRHNSR